MVKEKETETENEKAKENEKKKEEETETETGVEMMRILFLYSLVLHPSSALEQLGVFSSP